VSLPGGDSAAGRLGRIDVSLADVPLPSQILFQTVGDGRGSVCLPRHFDSGVRSNFGVALKVAQRPLRMHAKDTFRAAVHMPEAERPQLSLQGFDELLAA